MNMLGITNGQVSSIRFGIEEFLRWITMISSPEINKVIRKVLSPVLITRIK